MKKLNKFFAILVALAMMAMLAVTSAFAAEETEVTQSNAPGKAAITKNYDVPAGVSVPKATFIFDFENKEKPSSATGTLASQKIEWNETEVANLKGEQHKYLLLKDVFNYDASTLVVDTTKSVLTQPGEYVYVVKENEFTSQYTAVAAPSTDNMDYSSAVYTLRIYVIREGENLKIKTITVEEGDTSTTVPGGERKKVNPDVKSQNNDTPGDISDDYEGSDFDFTNVYTKTVKTDSNDKDGAFNIAKTVTGSGDTAVGFPFTATIKLDEKTTLTDNKLVGKIGDTEVVFDFGTSKEATQTFTLANGQKLVFAEFPAGATVDFEETLANSNIQKKDLYTKKTSGSAVTAKDFAKEKNAKDTTIAINEKANVAVENNLDEKDIGPEGILISNLPYIALALVAIGGLVAYVVVRRKADDEA